VECKPSRCDEAYVWWQDVGYFFDCASDRPVIVRQFVDVVDADQQRLIFREVFCKFAEGISVTKLGSGRVRLIRIPRATYRADTDTC